MFSSSRLGNGGSLRRPGANVVRSSFNIQASNWATGTGASPAPSFLFGSRRIHDCGCEWIYLETSKGVFSWTNFDAAIASLPAGSDATYLFCHPAAWASTTPGVAGPYGLGSNGPPTSDTDWTDYIAAVLNRHGSRFRWVEGWNESNLPLYFTGSVSRLVQLQNLLYATVKSLYPKMPVLSPSVTGISSLSLPINGTTLQSYRDAGALFDVVNTHVYVNTALTLERQTWNTFLNVCDTAQIAKKLGMSGVVSEFGQQNWAALSETDKEKYLKRSMMMTVAHGLTWFWYSYDSPATGDITAGSRQQWWIDVYNALVGHYVEFGGIDSTGVVTVYADGVPFSF